MSRSYEAPDGSLVNTNEANCVFSILLQVNVLKAGAFRSPNPSIQQVEPHHRRILCNNLSLSVYSVAIFKSEMQAFVL